MKSTFRKRPQFATVVVACVALLATSCGGNGEEPSGEDDGGAAAPDSTEVVTHNEPGGGSDVFIRGFIEILRDEGIIEENWPVVNVPEGDSIGAMADMLGKSGEDGTISQITATWIVTPLTVEDDEGPTLEDLTPIASLATEPIVVAARADSPYEDLTDFIEAAETESGLVQVGGSTTATDSLTGTILKEQTGTDWRFLSFEDGGSRITALLRGDADVMFGSPGDFTEQVRAGDLEVITVFGSERVPSYPDAPTTDELGIELDVLPVQFRAVMGVPDMPQSAVDYYADVMQQLVESDGWATYAEENGIITDYISGEEFDSFLGEQTELYEELIGQLGL